MRKFEIINEYIDKDINIPKRSTKYSSGYDIESATDIVIPPFKNGQKPVLVPTGLKVCMNDDEYLMLVNRSSGPKRGLILSNSVGIIDKDYYNNENNEGHIMFQFYNFLDEPVIIKKHDRIGQGIFMKYLICDDDNSNNIRTGGFGSTGN